MEKAGSSRRRPPTEKTYCNQNKFVNRRRRLSIDEEGCRHMVKAPLQKAADRTIRLPTEAERCRQKKKGVDRRRRLLREEESCRQSN